MGFIFHEQYFNYEILFIYISLTPIILHLNPHYQDYFMERDSNSLSFNDSKVGEMRNLNKLIEVSHD